MSNRIPTAVAQFARLLLADRPDELSIDVVKPPLVARRGILTTSRMQYCDAPFNLLGRELEYRIIISGNCFELSLQLYLNINDHYRLFVYSRRGMLTSVNLTTAEGVKDGLEIAQTMKITTQSMTHTGRAIAKQRLMRTLAKTGVEIDSQGRVTFGTFNAKRGFVDTSTKAFLRRIISVALIKGHFMGNKGLNLKHLQTVKLDALSKSAANRVIPAGLREMVFERDKSRCRLCGARVKDGAKLHVDHVIPVSKGGLTTLRNLRALCSRCNLGKSDRLPGARPQR